MQSDVTIEKGNKEGLYAIQDRLCIAICWFVLSLFLTNMGLGLQDNYGISQKGISLCLKLITVIIFVWALWHPILVSPAPAIFTITVCGMLALISSLIQPNNIYFTENIIMFLIFTLPIVITSFYIIDYACLLNGLRKVSLLIGYACLAMLLLFTRGIRFFSLEYSMGLSYSLLLPLLVLVEYNFERIKISYVIAVVSTFATILIFGSRGAILCVVCYMLFVAIKQKKWKILAQIFMIFLMCSIFFYCFGEKLMLYLADNNVQARSLMIFSKMRDQGVELSGREYLYTNAIAGIKEAPFMFKGMFASYMLSDGVYPHNIFLEAWYDLGIFSTLFFCGIALAVLKTFSNKLQSGKIELILLSYCIGLFVSGSFWCEPYFWMWLVFALKNATVTELDDDEYYESAK